MSRRRLKGQLELFVVFFAVIVGLGIILISQILVAKGIVVSKKVIDANMYVDDRGTELVSLMKSGEDDIITMYVLGTLPAEDYEKHMKDYMQRIEERVERMGINHELVISGESLAYYLGKTTQTQTPTHIHLSAQTCVLQPSAGTSIKLKWPSSGKRISSGIGYREIKGGCDCHGGVDVGGDSLDVYAVADGVVLEVYPDLGKGETVCNEVGNCLKSYVDDCRCNHGYGNEIVIEHEFDGKKYRTYYYHLKSVEPGLKEGSNVKAGDLIGKSGNTGYSEAAHLHFELRGEPYAADANSINPCELFETKDWRGDCVHKFPDVCKVFRVYGAYIPIPGAQPGNLKTEVSLRAW